MRQVVAGGAGVFCLRASPPTPAVCELSIVICSTPTVRQFVPQRRAGGRRVVIRPVKKVKVAHTRLQSVEFRSCMIPVLGSQPAGDVSHKPGGRLPLLSVRPAVTPATLKRTATNFVAW